MADRQFISSILIFLASIVFAGAVFWQGTRHSGSAEQQPPALPFTAITTGEEQIPHFEAGNINGAVTSVSSGNFVMAVIAPGSNNPGSVSATVTIDQDKRIFKMGAQKDATEYNNELAAYLAGDHKGPSPQPYEEIMLRLSDLKAGVRVNVLPKAGSVNVTSLYADTVMVTS